MRKAPDRSNYSAALAGVTLLFFTWGFVTCLNDVLQPILANSFHLKHFQANLVQGFFFFAYFAASLIYFLLSLSIGDPMARMGYKRGMILGLLIAAAGCAMFYPAAQLHAYPLFLAALFLLGIGFTLLQIAANPYVTLLGPPETASSRLNLSQAFNSFGTTIAPVTGGYALYELFKVGAGASASSVRFPYLILAGLMIALAVFIYFLHLPEVNAETTVEKKPEALKHPNLRWGMLAIFFYVGAEVAIGANLIKLWGEQQLPGGESTAKLFLAFYWGGAMIGRFLGSVMMGKATLQNKLIWMIVQSVALLALILALTGLKPGEIWPMYILVPVQILAFLAAQGSPSRTLFLFALAAMALLGGALATTGITMIWLTVGVGLFNSIMWSNIFSLAIAGLGKYSAQGSSLLIMMILGGAALPLLMGYRADQTGSLHSGLIIPMIAYGYLAFYGIIGYKPKSSAQ